MQNLSSSLSSVAKLYQTTEDVTGAVVPLVNEVVMKAEYLDVSQIATCVWAAGELELNDEQIYKLTGALLRELTADHLQRFRSRELANLVWGLANLGERDEGLLRAVARIVAISAVDMPQKEASLDLPMLISGFQRLMYQDENLLRCVAERLLKRNMLRRTMNDWGLCALAWAWPDVGDDLLTGSVRSVREVLDLQLERKKLTSRDVERSVKGPSRWRSE